MVTQEMPIFIRCFEFLSWLVPVSNHFPRSHRFTFTQRMLNAAFDLSETLQAANLKRGAARKESLNEADVYLIANPAEMLFAGWFQKSLNMYSVCLLTWTVLIIID